MGNVYDSGDLVRVSATFTNADDDSADPTAVTFKWQQPDGTETEYVYGEDDELVKDDTGDYHVDLSPTTAGRHYVRFEGTGSVQAAVEGWFAVRGSEF